VAVETTDSSARGGPRPSRDHNGTPLDAGVAVSTLDALANSLGQQRVSALINSTPH